MQKGSGTGLGSGDWPSDLTNQIAPKPAPFRRPGEWALVTLRPTTSQATSTKAFLPRAVMLIGTGKRSRKVKNRSLGR
jgi:tartrate dehydratase beta subunit/fumarate hydratase class I family protein